MKIVYATTASTLALMMSLATPVFAAGDSGQGQESGQHQGSAIPERPSAGVASNEMSVGGTAREEMAADTGTAQSGMALESGTAQSDMAAGSDVSFSDLDENSDGQITQQEGQDHISQDQWSNYDANRDDRLDRSEFAAFESERAKQESEMQSGEKSGSGADPLQGRGGVENRVGGGSTGDY